MKLTVTVITKNEAQNIGPALESVSWADEIIVVDSNSTDDTIAIARRYATRIEFDPRFERVRPPGFPQTDRYEIETWDGRWRLAEAP